MLLVFRFESIKMYWNFSFKISKAVSAPVSRYRILSWTTRCVLAFIKLFSCAKLDTCASFCSGRMGTRASFFNRCSERSALFFLLSVTLTNDDVKFSGKIYLCNVFLLCSVENFNITTIQSASTYLSVSLNVKYRQIRDGSVLIIRPVMEEFVSWFCAIKKVNFEKACWRTRDHGPFTKTTSSARLCLEFLQRLRK